MQVDIRLESDGFRKKKWVLYRDEALKELMGEPMCCQNCHSILKMPFYMCETDHKWYCKKCTFPTAKKLRVKEWMCKYDQGMKDEGDEHFHICIKEIVDEQ